VLIGQRGNYKIRVKCEKNSVYHATLIDARTGGSFPLSMDCTGAIEAIGVAMHMIDQFLTPRSVVIESDQEPRVDDDLAAQVNAVLDGGNNNG